MNPIAAQFLTDADAFGSVVRAGGDWSAASPCVGWSAADVVDHVITTQRDFLTRHTDALGSPPSSEPAAAWAAHRAALDAAVTDRVLAREFDGYFGPTTVGATLEEFYGWDLLIHRWDLGRALGQVVALTDAELDRVESHIPAPGDAKYEVFYSAGICAEPVPAPDGADRQTRVLARLGRMAGQAA